MEPYAGRSPDQSTMTETFIVMSKLVGYVAAGYILISIGAHFLSLSMIFPRPPVQYSMGRDYIQLTAEDGVKLAARHWSNPTAKFTVLYLHGNYEELGSIGEYLPKFVAGGYAVFALDYRRYGQSEGSPTESNTNADVRLAYNYIRNTLHVPAEQIIIFGYSLGSGPAVELALHEPAAGLVLQGPYLSTYRVMTQIPLLPWDKWVNIAKVPRLTLPVLVIHGTADGTVPFSHGARIYDAITARKSKLFIEGGPHSRLEEFAGARYWQALREFSDSLDSPAVPGPARPAS